MPPEISVCIVSYDTRAYLRDCLNSLFAQPEPPTMEVIVADNGSQDGSLEMMSTEFPQVRLIANPTNLGYTLPMNQALRAAQGQYLIQLNPDTVVHPEAFQKIFNFMQVNPQVGICSPKVLNADGTFQAQCRRGFARPWDVITYFSGLSRLFPHSRLFGRYLLTWLGEDEAAEVDAVSGSCMWIRRGVVEQIGYLDEAFFAYQEDTDFCYRAKEAGWQVFYQPEGVITHFGGQGGSANQPWRAIYQWHRSYLLYYRKHHAPRYCFLVNWLMYAGFVLKLGLAFLGRLLHKASPVGTRKPPRRSAG